MKPLALTITFCCYLIVNALAQIPNAGLENWTHNTFPSYDNPNGWGTVNSETAIINVTTVKKSTDVHGGSYAAKLETFYIAFAGETAPGIMGTGTFNTTTRDIEGGFVYNQRPTLLTGWYKYAPASGDNCDVSVELWRWNGGVRETVAQGHFTKNTAVSSYSQFYAILNYSSSATPDSARIIISSSNTSNPVQGSVMYVDDISFATLATFSVTKDSTNASCSGACNGKAAIVPSGGQSPYTYAWSGGGVDSSKTGLCSGMHNVTITDAIGQTLTASFNIINATILTSPTTTSTNENCGQNDGTATVTATAGTSPFTYLWGAGAGNQTTQTATSLSAGMYNVTVTDNNGCTVAATATVGSSGGLAATTIATDVNCYGGNDGTATVTPVGGTAPYAIIWDNAAGSQTDTLATSLYAGTYSVTVTDDAGCAYTTTASVAEPTALTATLSSGNILCHGGQADINLTVTGGTPSWSYLWGGGQTTPVLQGQSAGSYSATVTDDNGCSTTANTTLTEPDELTIDLTAADATTNGGNDGNVVADVTGGTPPFTFEWNNTANTDSVGDLSAGTYSVTITDANGCSLTETATVSEPVGINGSISSLSVSVYPNPFKDELTVVATTGETTVVRIYNSVGALMLVQKGTGNIVIPTAILQAGYFVLELETAGHKITQRLIKL